MTKDQYAEESAHPEVLEVHILESSAHPEVLEDHEVPFALARDKGNSQKIPDYVRTMDLVVKNIDKNDKNTRITIYKANGAP